MKKYAKIRRFWRTWRGLIVLGLGLLILIMFAGCTTSIKGDSFCLIYRPVYADYENDTPETIQQIDANNVVYDMLCT